MNLFKITMMALAITMFQSCGNKDEKTSDLEPLTQQEGKSSIESSSVNLLNDIEGFKDDKSVEAVVDLAKYFDGLNSSAKKSQGQLLFQSFLNDVVDVKSGKKQLTSLNEPLVMPEEDLDFKTYYESNKGEYTFNESTKEFEKTGSSAGMVFKVVYNGKTAKFELSNYTTTDYVGYTKGEILKSIAVSLVIDQLEVMKYTFNVDFYKYMPKSINTSYKLGAVEITALLNNSNNTVVSEDTEVKLYGKSIFSEEVSVTGDFKVLDNATNEEEFENASESVLKSILKADTKFVIGGIILNANANVKAILEGEDNLPNGDGKVKIEAEAKLINANSTSTVIDEKGVKVADVKMFASSYEVNEEVYNENTGSYNNETYIEYTLKPRFVFADGSNADVDTYFSNGFADVKSKVGSVTNAYQDKFIESSKL